MNKTAFELALAARGIHTTRELSDVCGINRVTLAGIRSGRHDATQAIAEHIAKALHFSMNEFKEIFPLQAEIYCVKMRFIEGLEEIC